MMKPQGYGDWRSSLYELLTDAVAVRKTAHLHGAAAGSEAILSRKACGFAHQEGICRMNGLEPAITVSSGVGCAAALISRMRRGGRTGDASCESS